MSKAILYALLTVMGLNGLQQWQIVQEHWWVLWLTVTATIGNGFIAIAYASSSRN